jgi:hypothetical protein
LRSNRTIVGLKPYPLQHKNADDAPQQSHHCGIETEILPEVIVNARSSNRTIVGLKRSCCYGFVPVTTGSNRTIVGLKLRAVSISLLAM